MVYCFTQMKKIKIKDCHKELWPGIDWDSEGNPVEDETEYPIPSNPGYQSHSSYTSYSTAMAYGSGYIGNTVNWSGRINAGGVNWVLHLDTKGLIAD